MVNKKPSKDDLVEQNEVLAEENQMLKEKMQGIEEMVEEKIAIMQEQIDNTAAAGGAVPEAEVELIYEDPYEGQFGHRIKMNPPGFVLGWKNEKYREPSLGGSRGWRGWVPIEYDDEIGRNLKEFLDTPPLRMEGSSELDNKVRRGDTILCKLPEDIWIARQMQRSQKDASRRGTASSARNKQIREGVVTYGDGVKEDSAKRSNPREQSQFYTRMLNRQKE